MVNNSKRDFITHCYQILVIYTYLPVLCDARSPFKVRSLVPPTAIIATGPHEKVDFGPAVLINKLDKKYKSSRWQESEPAMLFKEKDIAIKQPKSQFVEVLLGEVSSEEGPDQFVPYKLDKGPADNLISVGPHGPAYGLNQLKIDGDNLRSMKSGYTESHGPVQQAPQQRRTIYPPTPTNRKSIRPTGYNSRTPPTQPRNYGSRPRPPITSGYQHGRSPKITVQTGYVQSSNHPSHGSSSGQRNSGYNSRQSHSAASYGPASNTGHGHGSSLSGGGGYKTQNQPKSSSGYSASSSRQSYGPASNSGYQQNPRPSQGHATSRGYGSTGGNNAGTNGYGSASKAAPTAGYRASNPATISGGYARSNKPSQSSGYGSQGPSPNSSGYASQSKPSQSQGYGSPSSSSDGYGKANRPSQPMGYSSSGPSSSSSSYTSGNQPSSIAGYGSPSPNPSPSGYASGKLPSSPAGYGSSSGSSPSSSSYDSKPKPNTPTGYSSGGSKSVPVPGQPGAPSSRLTGKAVPGGSLSFGKGAPGSIDHGIGPGSLPSLDGGNYGKSSQKSAGHSSGGTSSSYGSGSSSNSPGPSSSYGSSSSPRSHGGSSPSYGNSASANGPSSSYGSDSGTGGPTSSYGKTSALAGPASSNSYGSSASTSKGFSPATAANVDGKSQNVLYLLVPEEQLNQIFGSSISESNGGYLNARLPNQIQPSRNQFQNQFDDFYKEYSKIISEFGAVRESLANYGSLAPLYYGTQKPNLNQGPSIDTYGRQPVRPKLSNANDYGWSISPLLEQSHHYNNAKSQEPPLLTLPDAWDLLKLPPMTYGIDTLKSPTNIEPLIQEPQPQQHSYGFDSLYPPKKQFYGQPTAQTGPPPSFDQQWQWQELINNIPNQSPHPHGYDSTHYLKLITTKPQNQNNYLNPNHNNINLTAPAASYVGNQNYNINHRNDVDSGFFGSWEMLEEIPFVPNDNVQDISLVPNQNFGYNSNVGLSTAPPAPPLQYELPKLTGHDNYGYGNTLPKPMQYAFGKPMIPFHQGPASINFNGYIPNPAYNGNAPIPAYGDGNDNPNVLQNINYRNTANQFPSPLFNMWPSSPSPIIITDPPPMRPSPPTNYNPAPKSDYNSFGDEYDATTDFSGFSYYATQSQPTDYSETTVPEYSSAASGYDDVAQSLQHPTYEGNSESDSTIYAIQPSAPASFSHSPSSYHSTDSVAAYNTELQSNPYSSDYRQNKPPGLGAAFPEPNSYGEYSGVKPYPEAKAKIATSSSYDTSEGSSIQTSIDPYDQSHLPADNKSGPKVYVELPEVPDTYHVAQNKMHSYGRLPNQPDPYSEHTQNPEPYDELPEQQTPYDAQTRETPEEVPETYSELPKEEQTPYEELPTEPEPYGQVSADQHPYAEPHQDQKPQAYDRSKIEPESIIILPPSTNSHTLPPLFNPYSTVDDEPEENMGYGSFDSSMFEEFDPNTYDESVNENSIEQDTVFHNQPEERTKPTSSSQTTEITLQPPLDNESDISDGFYESDYGSVFLGANPEEAEVFFGDTFPNSPEPSKRDIAMKQRFLGMNNFSGKQRRKKMPQPPAAVPDKEFLKKLQQQQQQPLLIFNDQQKAAKLVEGTKEKMTCNHSNSEESPENRSIFYYESVSTELSAVNTNDDDFYNWDGETQATSNEKPKIAGTEEPDWASYFGDEYTTSEPVLGEQADNLYAFKPTPNQPNNHHSSQYPMKKNVHKQSGRSHARKQTARPILILPPSGRKVLNRKDKKYYLPPISVITWDDFRRKNRESSRGKLL